MLTTRHGSRAAHAAVLLVGLTLGGCGKSGSGVQPDSGATSDGASQPADSTATRADVTPATDIVTTPSDLGQPMPPEDGGFVTGDVGNLPAVDPHIVIDQFGYLSDSEKIAVIRNPQTGFDATDKFTPGATYALVNAATLAQAKTGAPVAWNNGATDTSSGDKAWWFDFSDVTAPGDYYVLDVDKNVRSYLFRISDTVYRDVLKAAVRMFFYQRVGQAKDAAHAGAAWADGASHVGPLQDHNCRLYSDKSNAATEKDLWGGWYDAGDFNKYTNWTANNVQSLLRSYAENPSIWTDDYDIHESGNGLPDILDEAKWGLDYLKRLQNSDGSVVSIVGEASGSPPSSATGQSLYGSPSTQSALTTAAAFAYGSRVLRMLGDAALASYADDLLARAQLAWSWAAANPKVTFYNNDSSHGTSGLGSGQQQSDDWSSDQLNAAVQLFAATGDATYKTYVDQNYGKTQMMNGYVAEWNLGIQDALLDYAGAAGATATAATAIKNAYLAQVKGSGNLGKVLANPAPDPYMAWLDAYTWGSNSTKAAFGDVFYDVIAYGLDAATNPDARRAAERYIHYLHGVNPLGLVYLSNMGDDGAEKSVTTFYHTWFCNGSALWDQLGVSTYGPPPGYLPGGPNPGYDWDGCCGTNPTASSCSGNGAKCTAESISPPKGQPDQKSYKDFNTDWPLDSWSVTEPDDGYQVPYIRLLSKFVR